MSHSFSRSATYENTTYDDDGNVYKHYTTSPQNYYTTIYAQWTLNTYTVSYNKGSYGTGSNVSDSKTHGQNLTLRGAIFTRTGYTQTGWSTTDGGPKAYNLSATYSSNSSATLYPYWSINSYTVTYNVNGGTGTFANQTKNYGDSFTIHSTKPTKGSASAGSYTVTYNANGGGAVSAASATRTTNYTFSSWNTAQNGSGTSYAAGGTYSANASATLYAQYTSSVATAAVTLPTTTRSGYTLNGWYTAASGGTKVGNAGASYTPTGNVTLYAQWTASSATLSSVTSPVDCGSNLTGNWTSTGDYYYKLKVTCGNATAAWSNVTAKGAQTATVQIPTSWYSMSNGPLRDATSATATCELYTYSNSGGTTQVGTASSKTFTVKVPTGVVPSLGTLTAASSSDNAVVSGWGSTVFVQGYSKVSCGISVSSYNGSRFSSVRYYGPGLDSTMTSLTGSGESSVINSSGTLTYTAVVTDTRGRSASKTVTVTVQPYAQPSVAGIAVARCDSDGTVNNSTGAYFKATPVYSFSSVTVSGTAKNALVTQNIKYRVHPNGAWSTAEPCVSGTTCGPWSALLTNSYDVMVTLADRIQNGSSQTTTFMTTLPTVQGVWIGKGNDRLGLGGVPPSAGLHCDWNATFNGVVDVTPRRCYAMLPTTGNGAGWYRVLTYNGSSLNEAYGSWGRIFDFNITRARINTNNEVHKITLLNPYNVFKFTDEASTSNYGYVDKIRVTVNATTYQMHVDIHYNTSQENYVTVDFNLHTYPTMQYKCVANGLENVDPSPSGETVLTEYSFAANTPIKRTYVGTLAGSSSVSYSYATCATVKAARGSNSTTFVDAIADTWNGVSYSSRNDNFATVTASSNTVTLNNVTAGVMNYIIETF